jgi:hypothetical protein
MTTTAASRFDRPSVRRAVGLVTLIFFVASVALLVVPARIIHPFRAQTPRGIALAFFAVRAAGFVIPIAALIAIAATFVLWRGSRSRVRKVALVAAALLLAPAAVMTRQRPIEWMFNPIQRAAFARAGEASWVALRDDVLVVTVRGDAVAYPVRQIAYHHIVHDDVGGEPIVVTY